MGLVHPAFAGAGEGNLSHYESNFCGMQTNVYGTEKLTGKPFLPLAFFPPSCPPPSIFDNPVHIGCSSIKSSCFTCNKKTLRQAFGFKTPTVFSWSEFGLALTRNQELPQKLACDWRIHFRLSTFELFWFLTPLRNISASGYVGLLVRLGLVWPWGCDCDLIWHNNLIS